MHIKKINRVLLVGVFFLVNSTIAPAAVLFQDNFDNSPDWQSKQTVHKSVSGGYDISWDITRSDTCTTNCPPQGWTSYRAASSHWTDDRRKDTYVLDASGARGATGKGITYNVEVTGNYGTWSGGSLDIWLGEAGYKELFVRYYLKFDPSWKWTNPASTEHHSQKLARIATFNENIWTTNYNPQGFGSISVNWPASIVEIYYNSVYSGNNPAHYEQQVRRAPDYEALMPVGDYNALILSDGQWHCYEFQVKMNSAVGVADGEWRFYRDGTEMISRTDVIWKKIGSDMTHDWNWVMLLDNVTNASASLTDHVEMPMYMDDVVISTSYIGPDNKIILQKPTF